MNKTLIEKYLINLDIIKDVQWKTEYASTDSALFYSLSDNSPEKIALFEKRIESSAYQYCFINRKIQSNRINIIEVLDQDWLPLQKELCDVIYPIKRKFFSIAVTGTNGKTTTVDLIRQLTLMSKKNVLTIGTLGVYLNEDCVNEFGLTSPSFIDLRKFLYTYGKDIDVFAAEVSSHALVQERYFKFTFDLGIWTSFSQDHLDYHKTMEEYFLAKMKIFDVVSDSVFIHQDDKEIISKIKNSKLCIVKNELEIKNSFFKADYNKKNLLLALSTLNKIGINPTKEQLEKLNGTPGRFNVIERGSEYFIVDFAHTPDALENILKQLKKSFEGYKIVTIFGCGGDRDRTKRPLMGKIASENSDYVFVTSDNPRFEIPELIINDIVSGITRDNYQTITERESAIIEANKKFKNCVFLIAGKGHENYIDQNGVKRNYSDEEVVRSILNDKF